MHFSGSYIAKFLHPYSHPRLSRNPVHSPPALRESDLQVCPHTTLLPHTKTGVHLREHQFDLHVMWRSELVRPAPALASRGARSGQRVYLQLVPARNPRPWLQPALMQNARRRPWKHVQRTVAPAREHSHQRLEPHGRCARPHQDGFHRRSGALQ